MSTLYWKCVLLFFVSNFFLNVSAIKWFCDQNNCISDRNRNFNDNQTYYVDINVCRLVCNQYASLWPVPKKSILSKSLITISPAEISFQKETIPRELQDLIRKFRKIFMQSLLSECGPNCDFNAGNSVKVYFNINSLSTELTSDTVESYTLKLKEVGNEIQVNIQSETAFGARHALETLGQLIVPKTNENGLITLVTLANVDIEDAPAYSYRGLLLDTARHFIPIPNILKTIEGLSSCKMNVLHWHITDSQSFPLEIPQLPQINRLGAYSEKQIYKINDIERIIGFAKHRGVRVILEFDSPSHVGQGFQWGPEAGLGDLAVCINKQPWRASCIQPPCGQFNPVNNNLYNVIGKLFKTIMDVINTNEYFHMGGDEVFFPCWNQTAEITDYLRKNGRGLNESDFLELWNEYQKKILDVWDQLKETKNSSIILWTSHLTDPEKIERFLNKKRYIIQSWEKSQSEIPIMLLKKGYRMIISTKDAWYLDHGFWGTTTYYNWRKVYQNLLPKSYLVLGGEACMWMEFCDEHSMDAKIWPRTAAVGERLWSNPKFSAASAESRFIRHRKRLLMKKIKADPVIPEYCELNDGDCQ